MSDKLSPAVSVRICKHMNEDHADAVAIYAQTFGNITNATSAEMIAIDEEGMDIKAQVNGEVLPVRIPFDHKLADAEDAHHTLIAMIKQARKEGERMS